MRHCMRRTLVVAVVLLISVALWGCATVERSGRVDSLNRTVKGFAALMLWEDFTTAQTFIGVREGTPKEVDFDYLENIQVTDYDILRISLNEEKNEATVSVSISYYHEYLNRVSTVKQKQVWWYDEVEEGWLMDGELPDFRS